MANKYGSELIVHSTKVNEEFVTIDNFGLWEYKVSWTSIGGEGLKKTFFFESNVTTPNNLSFRAWGIAESKHTTGLENNYLREKHWG